MRRSTLRPATLALFLLLVLGGYSYAAENAGQADLDEATDIKLGADSLDDLAKVITLCESALEKGLDKDNTAFAKQLYGSALIQRATFVTSAILDRSPPNPRWPQLRQFALKDLEKALTLDDKQATTHLTIARLQVLPGGDRKRAAEAADLAVKHASEDDEQTKSKALVLRAGLTDDAEKKLADYNEAAKLTPDSPEPLRARGLFYLITGKNEQALADFDAALKADPKHVDTHEARGLSLFMLKRYEDAIKSFDMAIDLNPDSTVAHMHRARVLAIQGNNKGALEDLEAALKSDPENVTVLLLRARVHQQAGDTAKAKADVETALKQRPGSPQALELRAVLFAGTGDFDQAVEDLEELRKLAPNKPELLIQLGMLYIAAKKPQKAIEAYTAAVDADKESWIALRGRADAQLNLGNHTDAIADYVAANKLRPKDTGILNNLAWVLATSPDDKLRDGKRSITLATEACELTEYKQPHILSTLAAGYAEIGDWENAVKWSSKAVELGGDEVSPQLKEELKSYQAKKPWREKTNLEEAKPTSESKDDVKKDGEKKDDAKKDDAKSDTPKPSAPEEK